MIDIILVLRSTAGVLQYVDALSYFKNDWSVGGIHRKPAVLSAVLFFILCPTSAGRDREGK